MKKDNQQDKLNNSEMFHTRNYIKEHWSCDDVTLISKELESPSQFSDENIETLRSINSKIIDTCKIDPSIQSFDEFDVIL